MNPRKNMDKKSNCLYSRKRSRMNDNQNEKKGKISNQSSPRKFQQSIQNLNTHENNICKEDYLRMIMQSLNAYGFTETVKSLEHESGINYIAPIITKLLSSIFSGKWTEALDMLSCVKFQSPKDKENVQFLLMRQQYADLVVEKSIEEAVTYLQREITPLSIDRDEINRLAILLINVKKEDFLKLAPWHQNLQSKEILDVLQQALVPGYLLPEGKLQLLVKEALELQQEKESLRNILYENSQPLLYRKECSSNKPILPTTCTEIFENHKDEIWDVVFSHDGKKLLSVGKDRQVIVWNVLVKDQTLQVKHVITTTSPAFSAVWSPDDSTFLIILIDNPKIFQYNAELGELIASFEGHEKPVQSICFFSNGDRFVSGGLDNKLIIWNEKGEIVHLWKESRVSGCCISQDDTKLYGICNEESIYEFNLIDVQKPRIGILTGKYPIMTINLSLDNKHLLISYASQEKKLVLFDISISREMSEYKGIKQGRYVLKRSFGGAREKFVVSGCEDSCVYIWYRNNYELLGTLRGHSGSVNAVSWNPKYPHLIVTGSDDQTLRLWTTPIKL